MAKSKAKPGRSRRARPPNEDDGSAKREAILRDLCAKLQMHGKFEYRCDVFLGHQLGLKAADIGLIRAGKMCLPAEYLPRLYRLLNGETVADLVTLTEPIPPNSRL